jgi:hypothetical protein
MFAIEKATSQIATFYDRGIRKNNKLLKSMIWVRERAPQWRISGREVARTVHRQGRHALEFNTLLIGRPGAPLSRFERPARNDG